MKDTFGRSVVGHSFSPITMSCLCFQTFHTPELSNIEIFGIRQLQLKFWSYQPLTQVHQFRTLPAQTIERSGPRDTDAADAEDGRAGDFHAILSYLSIAVLFLLPSLPFLPFLPCPALAKRHLHVVRVSRVPTVADADGYAEFFPVTRDFHFALRSKRIS